MMKLHEVESAALLGILLWAASVEAATEEEWRAPMGDVFSSQGRPANTTGTTGTQGVQGNPNCPAPVINGIRPKNWSCRTGTQATAQPAPERPWLDQFCPAPVYENQLYGEGYVVWPQTSERLSYKIWLM